MDLLPTQNTLKSTNHRIVLAIRGHLATTYGGREAAEVLRERTGATRVRWSATPVTDAALYLLVHRDFIRVFWVLTGDPEGSPEAFEASPSDTTLLLTTKQKCSIFLAGVTSNQLKRWLAKQGCTFESGHGGHVIVRLGEKMSVLPMHGSSKELGTGLVQKIKKDLGLR